MKHIWYKILVILILIFLFLSFNGIIAYSPSQKFDDRQNVIYSEYMIDWSVHLINQNNTYDVGNPEINNIEPGEDIHKVSVSSTETLNGSVWPMLSHDAQHTGHGSYSTSENIGLELWRIRGNESGDVWSSAVIDDRNIIYFTTIGSDSALYAIYQNGSIRWRYPADGRIWCTPALAEDGTIYFGTWSSSYFHALNPNGTLKWLFGTGPSNSPAIAEDGTIYVGSDNSIIWALNPNGTLKWSSDTDGIVMGCPAIGTDDTIYIGSGDHYLYALYPNGTLRWRFLTGGEIKGSASIATDETIYVPSFDGYLYALNPNGTMKWRASTGSSIAAAGVALAVDGTIYVGTEQLRAFYPNGTLKWGINVQGSIYGTVPAVSADETIYVSAGGSLVAVNPDGTEKWRKQLTIAQIHSSPCIGPDNRVYVGSEDYGISPYGYLHAFGTGQPKNISIEEPHQGHWYLFSKDRGTTKTGNLIVFGSVNIKVKASIEQEIDHVDFYVAHFKEVDPEYQLQYNDTTPPFEWTMNKRYGNDLYPHLPFDQLSIRVTGCYKGGCSWTEEILKFWYFHML